MWNQVEENIWAYSTNKAYYSITKDNGYQGHFKLYGPNSSLWIQAETIKTANESNTRELLRKATEPFVGTKEIEVLETPTYDKLWTEIFCGLDIRAWKIQEQNQKLEFYWLQQDQQYRVIFTNNVNQEPQYTFLEIGYLDFNPKSPLIQVKESIPDWITVQPMIDIGFMIPPRDCK